MVEKINNAYIEGLRSAMENDRQPLEVALARAIAEAYLFETGEDITNFVKAVEIIREEQSKTN